MPAVRTLARRPGSTRPVTLPFAPATKVPSRSSTHLRDAALLASAGLAGFGAAPLTNYPGLALPSLVLGAGGGAALAVSGQRTKRRRELQDRVLEALAPLLGVRHLDRRIVKMTRWTSGWPGLPGKVRIHHAPGAPDNDPVWMGEILAVLSSRLLARYEVARHEQRRCTIWLVLVTREQGAADEPPYSQIRAERAITELIGPTATVTGAELDGDQLRSITVTHQAGAKLAASGYRNRIERVISTMLPGRWRAIWDLEGDEVRFEVRPSLPSSVWLPPRVLENTEDLLRNYRQVRIPCAVDEDGREVLWYPAVTPHLMLTGGTGTGKTSAAHALLGQVTQYGWPVWVLDAKRVEFLNLRTWPNVQIVAGSIPQQVALIRQAWELMEKRYELIEDGKATVHDFEPLVVFLDEFAEFRSNLLEWYAQIKVKGDPIKPPTLAEVASLARKARTARIHLVLSTQRPDVELLGAGEMRDNFSFRISLGRLSPQGAMMMWENPAVGVSLPRACTGRAIATHEDGKPVEVQCYRFPDLHSGDGSDEHQLLEAIRPADARWPRLVIVPPQTEENLDGGEPAPPTFRDYARARWDLAENRPGLDPLSGAVGDDTTDGRELSSTLGSLGIATTEHAGSRSRPHLRLVEALEQAADVDDNSAAGADWGEQEVDEYVGYAKPVSCAARDLLVGDLIEVEDGSGVWVVVDEPPEDDVVAPGMIAVSWRGDGDESGSLSVSDDTFIAVRRPEDDA